jgi:hypothetical protein
MSNVYASYADAYATGRAHGKQHIYAVASASDPGRKLYVISTSPQRAVAEAAAEFGVHAFLTTRQPPTPDEKQQAANVAELIKSRDFDETTRKYLLQIFNARVTSEPEMIRA